jgi:hypothetical protein
MVTVSRGVLLLFLAPPLAPPVFSVLAPNPIQAGETPSFLSATAVPTGEVRHGLSRIGKRAVNQRRPRRRSQ